MKLRSFLRNIFITAFLSLLLQDFCYSQGMDLSAKKQPGLFIGITLGPSQSSIKNEGTLSVSQLMAVKKTSFAGSLELGYFFSDYIGLSSGIGFNSYDSQLTLGTYQNKFETTDSENETYERRITGSDIKERQKVGCLSIPLTINFRLPFSQAAGFFLQPGINMEVPISKSYTSSGTFTFKGYYPADNIVLENLPAFGFPTNVNSDTDGELELKSFGLNLIASAGFDFNLGDKTQIALGVFYNKSFSNISQYSSPDKFQLASDDEQINSMMGGSSKATFTSMGLKIIVRYFVK